MDKEPQVIDAEVVTESKELTATAPNGHTPEALAVTPVMDIKQAVERYEQMGEFVSKIMKEDIDFGTIPGTNKPTLLKPGAEKLLTFFGLSKSFRLVEKVEDWTGKGHDGEPFFYYRYRCEVRRGDLLIADSEASTNSWEKKYRWRWVNEADLPPDLDPFKLVKQMGTAVEFAFAVDKAETSGKYGKPEEYWQQFRDAIEAGEAKAITRKTRSDKTFDAWEIDATVYRIPNPDIADTVNTLQKMSQKRAMTASTLLAVNASEFFTQDLEDISINGDKPEPVKPAKAQPSNKVHWTKDSALFEPFNKYLKEKTLEMVNAIDALNDATDYDVKQLVDYKGSRDEAKAAIEKWITKQVNSSKKKPDILELNAAGLKTLLSISASELEHDAKFKMVNRKHKEKICASRMRAALQGNDDKRKRLMHWLFNQTSFTEVSDAQLQGTWVYLGSVQEFGVGVEPRIAKELGAAYDAALKESGFDDYEIDGSDEEEPEEVTA